jgi:hypothetical protein
MTFVSTNAARGCVATCGLCSVAAWKTVSAPSMHRATQARSAIEPTSLVNGPGMTSRPTAARPDARSVRISASPRCPELPVTRTVILAPIGQNSLCLLGRRGRRINAIGACASGRAQSGARADRPMIKARGRKLRRLPFATAWRSKRPRTGRPGLRSRGEFSPPTYLAERKNETRNGEGRRPGATPASAVLLLR